MSFLDSVTANLLNNFHVYGPTPLKRIPHLISEVSKV